MWKCPNAAVVMTSQGPGGALRAGAALQTDCMWEGQQAARRSAEGGWQHAGALVLPA